MMNTNDRQEERDTWQDGPDPWDTFEQSQQESVSALSEDDQWTDWQQRGYDTPAGPGRYHQSPHSGLGIASVVLTVLAGLGILVTLMGAMFVVLENPNLVEDDPRMVVIGLGILLSLMVAVIGGLLGLVGLFQSDRQKLFPILGCLIATLEVSGVVGIMVLSLMFG